MLRVQIQAGTEALAEAVLGREQRDAIDNTLSNVVSKGCNAVVKTMSMAAGWVPEGEPQTEVEVGAA